MSESKHKSAKQKTAGHIEVARLDGGGMARIRGMNSETVLYDFWDHEARIWRENRCRSLVAFTAAYEPFPAAA